MLAGGLVHRKRNAQHGYSDRDHLEAAAAWLARAQDAGTDGGIPGRYRLREGWTSSYPETTGYIIPTLLTLESEAGLAGYRARAKRCLEFLLSVQLESGAFPGMEIAQNREQPSIFNSAQILNGLTAWHRATGDHDTLQAARRAADWLTTQQDPDGAWRRHVYGTGKTYTYMAHAGCWLAEFGAHVGERRYLDAARRHLDWVLTHTDGATGWINDCGFTDVTGKRDAVTHTIAYTISGTLLLSTILEDERGLSVARRAARAVARRLELSKWLPGKLDAQWKPAAPYACLTGNAQMALIWLELHRIDSDPALVNAACRAIDLIKRAQPMRSRDPGVRGGIAGSDPVWGDYVHLAFPNWAAKFFIDALLAKRRTLDRIQSLPHRSRHAPATIPAGVPVSLPSMSSAPAMPRPRVVLVAHEGSHKVEQFTEAWSSWGFRPDAVIVGRVADPPRSARLREYVRDYGVLNLVRRVVGVSQRPVPATSRISSPNAVVRASVPIAEWCAARGIEVIHVDSFDRTVDLERVRKANADLFVFAGGGIMRAPMLSLARLGMLNAHMGLLPSMRGMNVTQWSAFLGVPTGCSVHLIDIGIDTGGIALFVPVGATDAVDVDALRKRVDDAQVEALGRVVRWVTQHGALPPVYAQRADEGRQYFAMHDELLSLLQNHLRDNASRDVASSASRER